MPAFDRVIIADWSASGSLSPARPSADAIWIGVTQTTGTTTSYHRSRHEAEAAIAALLAGDDRVFLGFDFPMGYPAGFARRLTGRTGAQSVWAWLAERIADAPDNRNNRFAVAEEMNRITGGPFWGRPAGLDLPDLPATKTADYPALGLPERRLVETVIPRAQPVWKLYTTGAAGSQGLMGQPLIHRLSQRKDVAVWPFDTSARRVTVAEVYPSLLGSAVSADPARIKAPALLLYSPTDLVFPAPLVEEAARKIAAAASAKAQAEGWNVVIAIHDNGGNLIYLERADGTQLGSIIVAQEKSATALLEKFKATGIAMREAKIGDAETKTIITEYDKIWLPKAPILAELRKAGKSI